MALENAGFLLVSPDTTDAPNSRVLTSNPTTSNLQFVDSGPGGSFTLRPILNLGSVASISTTGLLSYTGNNTFVPRSITSSGSIFVTNPDGADGNINLAVVDSTSTQKVQIQTGGTTIGDPESILNLISGNNMSVNAVDTGSAIDITFNASFPGAGTVTSVGVESTTGLIVTDSPITTSGVIQVDLPDGSPGQILAIEDIDPQVVYWIDPPGGSVTSVELESTTGLTIGGDNPITTSGTITIDLPVGTVGQVLSIESLGPQTLDWITPTEGTVTSVEIATDTGLLITGTNPITSSGTIDINLPTGTLNQVLSITGVSPQTLGWVTNTGTGTVTSVGISTTSGLTLGGANPVTSTGTISVDLPTGTLNQVLSITGVSPQTLGWVTPPSDTISITATSSTGLTVIATPSPITGVGTIHIDLPIDGIAGQVLSLATSYPDQTLQWSNAGGGGSVTSVGVNSNSGLIITNTPVTGSGTIGVNLPVGTLDQILSITGTGPQTIGWITPADVALPYPGVIVTDDADVTRAVSYLAETIGGSLALGGNSGGITGSENTMIGHSAGTGLTGNGNVGVGFEVFFALTTEGANTAVGNGAATSVSGISNCTYLGSNASSNNGLTNSTAVGANTTVTASNTLVLGNNASVVVGATAGDPSASAILTLDSTSQGFLQPVMTTSEKNAIMSPATGLSVYDSVLNAPYYYNGSSWIGSAGGGSGITNVQVQTFSSPGSFTYTPSAGMEYCMVQVVGAGGGGSAPSNPNGAGVAGGGGGYAVQLYSASTIGASQTGSVGLGGASVTSNIIGNSGTQTLFGTTLGTPLIGQPGSGGFTGGSAGGTASGGYLNLRGMYGGSSFVLSSGALQANGGTSFLGGIYPSFYALGAATGAPGTYGVTPGAGGGGAFSFNSDLPSGSGGNGLVIVTEYCS